jgi:putative transposase
MGRHPRLIVPGVALHVRHRGNDGEICFRQDNDPLVYLALLREAAKHRRCAIHAYCLMPNHVHLLATPADEEGCALLMRDLGRVYSSYFNRRYARWGALWEHPFRSCLVDSSTYVLACYRYIERNPVRAHIVDAPSAYVWSSYAGNTAMRADELLTPHAEYLALGVDEALHRRAYQRFVNDREDEALVNALREATDGGLPLVGDALRERLEEEGVRLEPAKRGPHAQEQNGGAAEQGELDFAAE